MKDLTPIPPSDPGFQLTEPIVNGQAPAAPKFRPQKMLFFLRKFWWIPVVTLTLSISAAVAMFFHTPPTFVSYGRMWETGKLQLPDGAAYTYDQDNYVGTMTELLRSRRMWDRTTNYMVAFQKNLIIWGKDGYIIPVDIQVLASPKSLVYTIEARSANPGFTPAYLHALMEQYKEYRTNVRGEVSEYTENSISVQVQEYERDMKTAQAALSEYEQSNNFAVLQEESTLDGNHLVKLKTELSDFQLEMNLLAARELEMDSGQAGVTNSSEAIFDSLRNPGAMSPSATGRLDADKQIELLKLERERLAKYLRPAHPKMVKLDEDIARAQKSIDVYRQQNHEQIVAARQALQIKIDSYSQSIKEWEAKAADVNERLAKADSLKQEVVSKQRMYDRLSTLNDNVRVSQHIDQDTLAVLDDASPSKRSYTESKTMLTQSVILGLGLGLGIVFLLAVRDDRFGSVVEVTEKFGDNVVGQVPDFRQLKSGAPRGILEVNDDWRRYIESFRSLRSALLYITSESQRPKVLLITSAMASEGKSTIAVNLARILAMGGARVLLVDGDLRKGRLHEMLGLQAKPGLAELLLQTDESNQTIQTSHLPGLFFMSRGANLDNSSDLLLGPVVDRFLVLARQFDHVIIDSSPVFATDDATTLAPKMDGILLVVRSHFSRASMVKEALGLLYRRQAKIIGLIVNRANSSDQSYHYYKDAGYYSAAATADETAASNSRLPPKVKTL